MRSVFLLLEKFQQQKQVKFSCLEQIQLLSKQLFEATLTFLFFCFIICSFHPQAFCSYYKILVASQKPEPYSRQKKRESLSFPFHRTLSFQSGRGALLLLHTSLAELYHMPIINESYPRGMRLECVIQINYGSSLVKVPTEQIRRPLAEKKKPKWLGWIMGSIPISPHTPAISSCLSAPW